MPIDIRDIEGEVLAGLPNERDRLEEALACNRYYEGDFEADLSSWDFKRESYRTSRIMTRVVDVLTGNLYREGPVRQFPDEPDATEFLEGIYRTNAIDAIWHEADRLSLVGKVAAIECYGNVRDDAAERPVGFNLWGAEQLCVWLDPDDQRCVDAVATLDCYDNTRRIRLWTADEVRWYQTSKLKPGQTAGGTAYRLTDAQPNPYGVLPFAFAHASFPARYFWGEAPGKYLRDLNYHVNYRLTQSADEILHNRAMAVVENADPTWNAPRDWKAGEWVTIPVAGDAGGNLMANGQAKWVVCDLSYLTIGREDLEKYLEHALQCVGVPISAVRMEQMQVRSGIQLVAEQIPVILWAKGRQPSYGHYERSLARVTCKVAAAHARNNGLGRLLETSVSAIEAAAAVPLALRWPEMFVELPGPERDQADEWLLSQGAESLTGLLMRRYSLTREEARERLELLAEDHAFERSLAVAQEPQAKPLPADPADDSSDDQNEGPAADEEREDLETDTDLDEAE